MVASGLSKEKIEEKAALQRAFGRVLRRLRIAKKLSQQELAWGADIDRRFISSLETGQKEPGLLTTFLLCRAVNVDVAEFMSMVEAEIINDAVQ